ncbi:hypothetical protein [Schaalia hyovaginalis]|uniref:Uncharacterized protein n=1 Tax=Schaalia hyovaginalis TaxID=29316 RepID=A0A923IZ94_9ACTO|nr:hypothetical protein [Schaalia hyovaginalis]MBB6335121.1 hypothetical protein [Schaalia hyovaginalis]
MQSLIEALDRWAHKQADFADFPIFAPDSDCGAVERAALVDELDKIISLTRLISSASVIAVKAKEHH